MAENPNRKLNRQRHAKAMERMDALLASRLCPECLATGTRHYLAWSLGILCCSRCDYRAPEEGR